MRCFLIFTAVMVLMPVAAAHAAPPEEPSSFQEKPYNLDSSAITPTPEMWFYMNELQRHDDPRMAVRRNAELRGQQRRSRLAAMKWFGLSNQRPQVNPTPICGVYSPTWVAGWLDPFQWSGSGYPVTVVLP